MRAVVVGGGPVGMFCGMVLARRGDDVIIVDRDPGPPARGQWARQG
jgi:2-polyprenyl-6-methoxyphenol hydroxylase-like FAD-dependent oxidoreductase